MTSTRAFFLFLFVIAIIVVLIALVPICLTARDSATEAIRGTVVDSSCSRMAQVSIVVVNTATGTRYTVTSDSEGRFALEHSSFGASNPFLASGRTTASSRSEARSAAR